MACPRVGNRRIQDKKRRGPTSAGRRCRAPHGSRGRDLGRAGALRRLQGRLRQRTRRGGGPLAVQVQAQQHPAQRHTADEHVRGLRANPAGVQRDGGGESEQERRQSPAAGSGGERGQRGGGQPGPGQARGGRGAGAEPAASARRRRGLPSDPTNAANAYPWSPARGTRRRRPRRHHQALRSGAAATAAGCRPARSASRSPATIATLAIGRTPRRCRVPYSSQPAGDHADHAAEERGDADDGAGTGRRAGRPGRRPGTWRARRTRRARSAPVRLKTGAYGLQHQQEDRRRRAGRHPRPAASGIPHTPSIAPLGERRHLG